MSDQRSTLSDAETQFPHDSDSGETARANDARLAEGENEKDAFVHIRRRHIVVGSIVAAVVVIVALAVGLGVGLGLPAARRAKAAKEAAAADWSPTFYTYPTGAAAASFRAADSAYITSTVPLVQYSASQNILFSTVPVDWNVATVTQLVSQASPGTLPSGSAVAQAVPQFFNTDLAPLFVTTATYTPVPSGRLYGDGGDDAGSSPFSTLSIAPTGEVWVAPKPLGAVDCPWSNGTQYIEPITGAVFTKFCYKRLVEADFNQILLSTVPAVSLDECIAVCAGSSLSDTYQTPQVTCNAVSYDANITRAEGMSCRLVAVTRDDNALKNYNEFEPSEWDLSAIIKTNLVDWAGSIAVLVGFIPGYTNFAPNFYLTVPSSQPPPSSGPTPSANTSPAPTPITTPTASS